MPSRRDFISGLALGAPAGGLVGVAIGNMIWSGELESGDRGAPPTESEIRDAIVARSEEVRDSELAYSDRLEQIARYHSRYMAGPGELGSEGPENETVAERYTLYGVEDRAKDVGSWDEIREGAEDVARRAIGAGDDPAEIARDIVSQWSDDGNVLEDWEEHGVGVYVTGGDAYTTQNYL